MELLKLFLSSLRIRRRRKVEALRTSNLAKLPPELIINIAELLPPIAAICFSLCRGPIYSLLGIRKLYRDEENLDTIELLEVLERDLPDYIVCYYCKRFHAIKYAKRHIQSDENLRSPFS